MGAGAEHAEEVTAKVLQCVVHSSLFVSLHGSRIVPPHLCLRRRRTHLWGLVSALFIIAARSSCLVNGGTRECRGVV